MIVAMFLCFSVCAEDSSIPKTGLCIVEQYKDNCGPCTKLARELDKIADLKIKIIKEKITGEAPILIFYKDGKAVKVVIGYIDEADIRSKIKELTP